MCCLAIAHTFNQRHSLTRRATMATSSSIGSDVFALLALVVISLAVLLLLRYYLPLRSTPAYLLIPVFLALALPSSIILLVPIDLASAAGTDGESSRGIWLPETITLVTWRIAYWLTFALTWVILPLLGEYSDSGYRDTRSRLIYSLKTNARYQIIVLGSGIAGLVYLIYQNGFDGSTIKGLVMALAYTWGLILAIYLMGHGLVALPRRLIKNASVSGRLKGLQTQAPKIKDKLDEAMEHLEQLEGQVMQLRQRKNVVSGDLQEWIEELADTSALPESRPSTVAVGRAAGTGVPAVVTERYVADLTRKLKRARHRKARYVDEWDRLVQSAKDTQTILDSATSQKLDFGREKPTDHSLLSNLRILTPSMRYHLYMHVTPALRVILGIFLAAASVAVIWSEVVKDIDSKLSLVGLTVVHDSDSSRGQIGLKRQLIAAAWLCYMCTAALYAISDVKVWGNRALVKRQTYAESACWYSLQVAKLTVPLSFNFITMMPPQIKQATTFYHFLGKLIDLSPLGEGFSRYFPILVLIPVLATLFNLYGKVKNVIGFGVLEDDSEENSSGFGTGGWREGRALIEGELQSDSTHLGLTSRPAGASLDQDRRAVAGTSTPPRPQRDTGRAPLISNNNRALNSATNEEEDTSDRYFFQDFSERVRNTFESSDRPDWVKNLGEGLKKPKWMQQDSDGGSGFKRWFGGGGSDRGGDGRVRL